jgi:uncharacterized repeat protein (TIGR01451 family)
VDALAAVEHAWLRVSDRAEVTPGFPADAVQYALTVTNTSPMTLTGATVTATVPAGTTLAWADDGYVLDGRTVSWGVPSLPPNGVVRRVFEVELDEVVPGDLLMTEHGATADQLSGPVAGAYADVRVPWRMILFPVIKNAPLPGPDDG